MNFLQYYAKFSFLDHIVFSSGELKYIFFCIVLEWAKNAAQKFYKTTKDFQIHFQSIYPLLKDCLISKDLRNSQAADLL